jgi:branched-chain amino acid transport system ATP-binding protein
MTLLSARGLSRNFGGLKAVDNVDFDLPAGEVRALIGPNGAGKTTFVGMLSGRIPASAGTVSFDGRDITSLPAHRRIRAGMAYTFQITSVFSRLPVAENVALALRWRTGDDVAATNLQVAEALERVGIADRANQLAGDLSYGHQRLLEIAMGLSQQPRLLILDEPTQGLADSEIADFVSLIRGLAGDMTILLLASGTPSEIRNNAAVQAAYLGTG